MQIISTDQAKEDRWYKSNFEPLLHFSLFVGKMKLILLCIALCTMRTNGLGGIQGMIQIFFQ